jgi:hypothetical protein
MTNFRGQSAGETLLHVLFNGGGALCLAVPKDAETFERGPLGRLVILTREFFDVEGVGLWTPFDYFTALKNEQNLIVCPKQLWLPGKKGFGEPVVLKSTDYLLRPSRPIENAYLAAKLYAHFDAFQSGLSWIVIEEPELEKLTQEAIYNIGQFLKKYSVPELISITQRRPL